MHKLLATCTLVVVILANPATAGEPFFMGLGQMEGYDSGNGPLGISGDGRVVVGAATRWPEEEFMAYRWTMEEGMVALGDIPGGDVWSCAQGASYDGSVVVGYGKSSNSTPGDHYEAFKWTAEGGMVGLGDLPGSPFDSRASAVSADGTVIVGRGTERIDIGSFDVEATRWADDQPAERITPHSDSRNGWASDVSADGSVIVGTNDSMAMMWTEENGVVSLGNLTGEPSRSSRANAVSADGQVVVGKSYISSANYEAFIWTQENGMVGIGDLPGGNHSSAAEDVSADGSIIVGTSSTDNGTRPFIWDADNGMRDLQEVLSTEYKFDLSDWSYLMGAASVSCDGMTIVGSGIRNGIGETWIAHLPEPGTAGLFAVIGAVLLARRRVRG